MIIHSKKLTSKIIITSIIIYNRCTIFTKSTTFFNYLSHTFITNVTTITVKINIIVSFDFTRIIIY